MSDFTGPGRNSEMSMIRSPNVSGPNLPTSSRWPGDSIWKQPRVWVERISRNVASSSSATPARSSRSTCTSSTRATSCTAWAIADCIRMPRMSSLSRPIVSTSSLSNWLIGKPIQLASTGVRSSSEPSDSTTPQGCSATWRGRPSSRSTSSNSRSSRGADRPLARSSGSSAIACPGVPGPDVREGLGDRVDLHRRHPEHGTHVADRVPDPVGVHHRHAGHPVTAEPGQDLLVDLGPPGRLHVDVDVGQLRAQRRAEPLHQQPVLHRVDAGDAEQVVDHAARPRPPRGDPHAEVADQVAHRRHGQEVRRVAEPGDDVQLVLQPGRHRPQLALAAPGVPGAHRTHAPGAQDGAGVVVRPEPEHPGLGQVDRPDAQVGAGVQDAPLGQGHRVGQQPPDLLPARAARSRRRHHLLGDQRHLRPGAQVARGGHPVQVTGVEGDQPAGRVEHVDGDRTGRVGVPDGVGQDRRQAGPTGQCQHPRGVPGAGRRPRRPAVADHLDHERARWQPGLPAPQDRQRRVRPAGQCGPADVGARPEQHDQRRCAADRVDGVLGDQARVGDRQPALPAQVRRRDQPAQPGPAHPGRRRPR